MYRRLITALIILLVSGLASAQESPSTLIAIFNDQVYRMQGDALVAYDACMPDEALAPQYLMAPDNQHLAMMTLPRIVSEAVAELGAVGDLPVGLNLWICDLQNDQITRVHASPGGDEPFTGELPDASIIQSPPAWSPDSQQVAWSNIDVAETTYGMVVYDLMSGQATEIPLDLPPPFNFPVPPQVFWGQDGIYLNLFAFNEETYVGEDLLYIFDLDTQEITNSIVLATEGESDDFITDRLLVTHEGADAFALRFFNQGWKVADVTTGEQTAITALPELYVSDNPEITVSFDVDADFNNNWQITNYSDAAGNPVVLEAYPLPRVALSPDGNRLAYADSVLHIWSRDGAVVDVANSDGFADDFAAQVLWAAPEWRIGSQDMIAQAAPTTCDGAPQSRLLAGERGRVAPGGLPNRVRVNPSTSAEIRGQIPPAGEFDILNGPVCAEGFAWYEVIFEGMQGWTAEGFDSQYFLEPLQ